MACSRAMGLVGERFDRDHFLGRAVGVESLGKDGFIGEAAELPTPSAILVNRLTSRISQATVVIWLDEVPLCAGRFRLSSEARLLCVREQPLGRCPNSSRHGCPSKP